MKAPGENPRVTQAGDEAKNLPKKREGLGGHLLRLISVCWDSGTTSGKAAASPPQFPLPRHCSPSLGSLLVPTALQMGLL